MKNLILLLATILWLTMNVSNANSAFVSIKSEHLVKDGRPYYFMGTNYWQGMNLGAPGDDNHRAQLKRELDMMQSQGIKQLRILALSEGPNTEPYRVIPAVQTKPNELNENLLIGLDYLLNEMKKRDMTAVICLSNFWPWSGGMSQWVSWTEGSSIPYPPPHPGGSWSRYQEYASKFYTLDKAVKAQQESVKKIVSRINTISNMAYSEDPTIMSWELANEPRGGNYRDAFLKWIASSAKIIKSIDKNHLITLGSEGETMDASDAGNNFLEDHASSDIDYATFHIWVENWGIYNPKNASGTLNTAIKVMQDYIADHVEKSKTLKKPVILEEFGMARDQRSMDPDSTTVNRDIYYQAVFQASLNLMNKQSHFSGVNFWAWSGENKPKLPYGSLWKAGDPLLGDPPHEEQGWYGVYSSDHSTLNVIKKFADQIELRTKDQEI
jgi:mannan endo-1,4-beta-mannosidase